MMTDTYAELLPLLDRPSRDPVRERAPNGGRVWSLCPCHDDGAKYGRRSLSLHPTYGLTCFAGCAFRDVARTLRARAGLHPARALGKPKPPSRGGLDGEIVASWTYTNAMSRALFRVVRLEGPQGKSYAQQHPDGRGGWAWGRGGAPYVLYRLFELVLAVPSEPVFISEGEKCADALAALGLVATTNAEGAGKWRNAYADELRGRRVIVLPDNDEPGEQHARDVARSLAGVASCVIVRLPGLPDKGDVCDWLAAGGGRTRSELLRLAGMGERALLEAVLA